MKYNQPQGPDTMEKKGVTKNITTKLQCITAMKEYEGNDLKGVLFANEPVCGAQATFTTGFGGFSNSNSCSNSGSDLHAKPFSAANTGFSFELGGRFGGFNAANTGLGVATSLGGTLNQTGANEAAQVQQTLIALSDSPYDDSPLFWYLKDSKTKREEVLKPTNPDTQKALLANQHQVSPRPMAKIRPKALSGALNGSKCLQNMESLIWLLVLLAVLLQCTFTRGEDVVTVTDNAPSIEGTQYTCTCKIRKKDYVVKWLNGNDGKPIVYCYKNSCHINSADERKYNHSCDLDNNIFNLTILNVTKDDNGKKFVCSNGINSDCAVLTVGGYEQRLEETDNGVITAVSAPSSDKNVTFKWIGVKPINGEEVKLNPKILNKSESFCFDECGNSRHMKYEETISVATSGNGKKYHLKVAVYYGAKRIVSNKTHVAYMIEEQEPKYEDSSESAVAVIAAVAAAVVVVVVVAMFCRKHLIRLFHTYFNRAENPINPEEGIESLEERPLNSVDTLAGLQEPEAKIEEKVELMSQTVNGDSNQGSDNGTPSVNPEEDQLTESSLPLPDFYLPMKDTKTNPSLLSVRYEEE